MDFFPLSYSIHYHYPKLLCKITFSKELLRFYCFAFDDDEDDDDDDDDDDDGFRISPGRETSQLRVLERERDIWRKI